MEKIPAFLYGKFADVKRATSRVVSQLKKGVSIGEIAADYEWIDCSAVTGKLILNGPSPLAGTQDHFHLFALPRLMQLGNVTTDPKYSKLMSTFFDDMMQDFWSHMVLSSGQSVYPFYHSEQNRIAYLRQLVAYKERYTRINDRFDGLPFVAWSIAGAQTSNINSIFDHPTFIAKYVVGNLDRVTAKFSREEINRILINYPLFESISKLEIDLYTDTSH